MLVAEIENLITETLIDSDFQEVFCANCEGVSVEEGLRFCSCEFTPSDGDCWRRKDWDRIAAVIHKLADMAGSYGD